MLRSCTEPCEVIYSYDILSLVMQNVLLQQKIQSLEKELKDIKRLFKESGAKKSKKKIVKKSKPLSIEGILKGVKFSEEEIEEAQKAIFSHSEDHIK